MLLPMHASLVVLALTAGCVASSAVSVPASTDWLGIDGTWSTHAIRVGTPPQWVDVLPSTVGQETLVVGLSACPNATCIQARGGDFAANKSSTFDTLGAFELGLDTQLGFNGAGYYGLDSIAFNDTFSLPRQIVGVVNDTQYWIGSLGLGVKGTYFTTAQQPSLLLTLGNNNSIPSLSYAYTAGASYQLKGVPSSLTLGGYDKSRFVQSNATYTLNADQQPVVAITSISVNASSGGTTMLMSSSQAELFTIDSTTPYLWLPEAVADNFAALFGFSWSQALQGYSYSYPNATKYQSLSQSNTSIQFQLAENITGSLSQQTVSLPILAFTGQTLTTASTNPGFSTPYFPIRRANQTAAYTLGRIFLQESYLIVDYERNNFSVSPALFSDNARQEMDLVDITSPSAAQTTSSAASPTGDRILGLTVAAFVGIGVGVAAVVGVIVGAVTFILLRRRRARGIDGRSGATKLQLSNLDTTLSQSSREPPDSPQLYELSSAMHSTAELACRETSTTELHGSDVPELSEIPAIVVHTPEGHDPFTPIELGSGDDFPPPRAMSYAGSVTSTAEPLPRYPGLRSKQGSLDMIVPLPSHREVDDPQWHADQDRQVQLVVSANLPRPSARPTSRRSSWGSRHTATVPTSPVDVDHDEYAADAPPWQADSTHYTLDDYYLTEDERRKD